MQRRTLLIVVCISLLSLFIDKNFCLRAISFVAYKNIHLHKNEKLTYYSHV